MQQIFKMLSEQAIGLRTKAVKALTQIVSVDSNILARVYIFFIDFHLFMNEFLPSSNELSSMRVLSSLRNTHKGSLWN